MSAFEVTVTPQRLKNKKRLESREPTDIVMAPFSAKAIVQFEDVPVGKTAKRILRILNPCEDDIVVKVTKPIKPDHNVAIDWTEMSVPALNVVEMEMVWNPLIDVACKETFQLTDDRNFRKDVMVILKSKSNKPVKNTRKFPTISSSGSSHVSTHVKTLRLKSPTGAAKATLLQQRKQRAAKTEKPKTTVRETKPTWNAVPSKTQSTIPPTVITRTSPLSERNTQQSNQAGCERTHISPNIGGAFKENISPLTPCNVMNLIDKLNFTPATETRLPHGSILENLASWPTPISTEYDDGQQEHKSLRHVRPRRLTAEELLENEEAIDGSVKATLKMSGDVLNDTKDALTLITNKTFDVKRTEALNSTEIIVEEVCTSEKRFSPCRITANNVTTILSTPMARPLEMIEEEDATENKKFESTSSQETCSDEQNLKRDIKLVGTPLRKYSESMKDLSSKSPQAKIAIQGSLPNLNEMEQIRSIEQNRYFHQRSLFNQRGSMSVIHEQNTQSTQAPAPQQRKSLDTSMDELNLSQVSLISHAELFFNQSEILAQSSRFNLNEVGLKSRKNSPVASKAQVTTPRGLPSKTAKENRLKEAVSSQKRRSLELSFSDSPSNESLASTSSINLKSAPHPGGFIRVSPPKRQRIDPDLTFPRPTPTNASAARFRNWSQTQPKKFRLTKTLSLIKKPITPRKASGESQPRIKLYDSDLYLQSFINPDPFAATTTCDPFLASTMYLDERSVDKHQTDFRKWLNALVSIPADLDADCNTKIDVGKLFNEVRQKELMLAPTKEEQSRNYLTVFRLESLRRAAVQLFLSEEMRLPCSKVAVYVNKNAIRIRSDRNLHLDVVMQRYILELLLCFNPLWLRLGLEVVYGEKIHLNSNRDIIGLSTFILNRLFRDKFLEQKYSKAYTLSEEYADHIKKFTLQKTLFLLLFLDKAKSHRIIKHNPCLFVKKSPYKETKEILLKFSAELLANIGDITRELKRLGYFLQHKQSFLDEFDYAFNNLAVDLRDGIRLTRVMEVILLRDDLSQKLRVPAISRLQRIFNVNLALHALREADFQLTGEITGADIVDGHREKTLSLLWQIIYKFRSPKFHAAARVLQNWWRHSWLRVSIRRRIRHKEMLRREAAATKIQAHFRGFVTRNYVKVYREERYQAAVVLQKHVRRFLAMKQRFRTVNSIIHIQRWYRAQLLGTHYRQQYIALRNCVVYLQHCLRRRWFARKLLQVAETAKLQRLEQQEKATLSIQRFWRLHCLTKVTRNLFLQKRQSAINMQQHYRAKKKMEKQRFEYLRLRGAVLSVQRRFRANKLMCVERAKYLRLRLCVAALQRRRRAVLKMRLVRIEYLRQVKAIVTIQRRVRATRQMQRERFDYCCIQRSVCTLQRRYRAHLAMKREQSAYQSKRNSIITIQRKWRATKLARLVRYEFISLQYYASVVQQQFRATKMMRVQRTAYCQLKEAAVRVQLRYRAKLVMRKQRLIFTSKLQAIITIQRKFRAYKQMRFMRAKFQGTRAAVSCLQQHVRGYLLMKCARKSFLQQRSAARVLQRSFRAHLAMRTENTKYNRLKAAVVCVQRRFRAKLCMQKQRKLYTLQVQSITAVQRCFRAKRLGRQVHQEYVHKRNCIINLQRRYRAHRQMLTVRSQYLLIRSLIVCIQRKFRAYKAMLVQRHDFLQLKRVAIHLQQKFRGHRQMQAEREQFLLLQRGTVAFQTQVRGYLARQRFLELMTPERIELLNRKKAAKLIQRSWRGYCVRKRLRNIRILAIRHNIKALKESASAVDSIRSKVLNAVHILRGRFNVSEALHVLTRLERLSRTVPHLLMGHSDFISNFCYGIMAQAIRSEVDKQLIEYSSRIILNLARFNSTTANTFQEGGLVTIAQMLLRWCDKDCEIFNTLCTLIWIFGHCPQKRQIIRNFMTTTESIYFIRETKKLVARKEKMKQNVRKPIAGAVPRSSAQQQIFSSRALPSLEPDYGVIRNKPYAFISSVYAFETILCKLGIDLF